MITYGVARSRSSPLWMQRPARLSAAARSAIVRRSSGNLWRRMTRASRLFFMSISLSKIMGRARRRRFVVGSPIVPGFCAIHADQRVLDQRGRALARGIDAKATQARSPSEHRRARTRDPAPHRSHAARLSAPELLRDLIPSNNHRGFPRRLPLYLGHHAASYDQSRKSSFYFALYKGKK